MSRSGYSDDCDGNYLYLYRNVVERSLAGKRGQAFLKELAAAMDAMPVKRLIANELVDGNGECCTLGVVCKARGMDASKIDYESADHVGNAMGISRSMAAEIEYMNDEWVSRGWDVKDEETPEERWVRMRKWVDSEIRTQVPNQSSQPSVSTSEDVSEANPSAQSHDAST